MQSYQNGKCQVQNFFSLSHMTLGKEISYPPRLCTCDTMQSVELAYADDASPESVTGTRTRRDWA